MNDRRPESGWSATQYDWDGDMLPSTAAVKAVAAVTGRASKALPPLYYRVDPDALDDLMMREGRDDVEVTFTYAGVTVLVTNQGTVAVRKDCA